MINKHIKGVLFDVDGTLVDTAPDLVAALNIALLEHGFETLPVDSLRHAASHGSLFLVKTALPQQEHSLHESVQQAMLKHYQQINGQHARLFDGIASLLVLLKSKQIPFGVVTNKQAKFARPLIQALALTEDCVSIIAGDSTKHSKPHTAPMLLAAQQLDIAPEHILYLGDAERDIVAAVNAGMIAGTALWGYISETDTPEQWPFDIEFNQPQNVIDHLKLIIEKDHNQSC